MSNLRNAVPASLRLPVLFPNSTARPHKPMSATENESRFSTLVKSRLAKLPQEPEDARITGVTRSLNRRLLALNVPGSLRMGDYDMAPNSKIA